MEPVKDAVIAEVEKAVVEAAPGVVSHILADAVDAAEALADEVVEVVEGLPALISSVVHSLEHCVLPVPLS